MLSPDDRCLLLDALRPPAGYQLDRAVGTSFSLDLEALLLCPLAFAFFSAVDDAAKPDPIALLAAVREHAERIDLFCQAGQIAVPREYRRIAAYLESSVHEVSVPRAPHLPAPIFHPKVWALRYRASERDVCYRLIVASRNLTFDRSWDTVLILGGEPTAAPTSNGSKLAAFVRALPGLAVRAPDATRAAALSELAADLERVEFSLPEGFDALRLHPLGIDAVPDPLEGRVDRLLIISPFLGAGFVSRHAKPGRGDILVSRPDSLDALGSAALAPFAKVFVLSSGANAADDQDEISAQPVSEELAEAAGMELRGLHAKVFVADAGRYPRVFTGSANATSAAFGGNVEFVAELIGKKLSSNIDALLDGKNSEVSLSHLLEPYMPANVEPREQSVQERLAERLDLARRSIASTTSAITVSQADDGTRFELALVTGPVQDDVSAYAYPITLKRGTGRQPLTTPTVWSRVSFEAITPFVVLDLDAEEAGVRESISFVVQAELINAPENRLERLLTLELQSPRSVLRYFVFLLAAGETDIRRLLGLWSTRDEAGSPGTGAVVPGLPLLESMVRALAHDPKKLDAVASLVGDLASTAAGLQVLPERFDEIWDPINRAREKTR